MYMLISILLLLPTLSFAAAQNCQTQPAINNCDNWMLNGDSKPNADRMECLVEERSCRNYDGCGALIVATLEKRLTLTCTEVLSAPPQPALSKFSPAD